MSKRKHRVAQIQTRQQKREHFQSAPSKPERQSHSAALITVIIFLSVVVLWDDEN